MPKVDVLDLSGKSVKELELSEEVFGIEPNEHAVYEAVKCHLANRRQGTQAAKTRAEKRGGGKKPWRQKGTGRARAGSLRSPIFVGGGVSFAPKPRSYGYKLPRKVRRLALRSALSSKVLNDALVVVENLDLEEVKTKRVVEILESLELDRKVLFVTEGKNDELYLSARNIENVLTCTSETLSVYDILNYDTLVVTEEAVKRIEEVYA